MSNYTVTDEMVGIAAIKFVDKQIKEMASIHDCMKAALQAVFDHICDATEKAEDGWIAIKEEPKPLEQCPCRTWKPKPGLVLNESNMCIYCGEKIVVAKEEKKEPKKQTLLELILEKHPDFLILGNKTWIELVSLISEYLEQNKGE